MRDRQRDIVWRARRPDSEVTRQPACLLFSNARTVASNGLARSLPQGGREIVDFRHLRERLTIVGVLQTQAHPDRLLGKSRKGKVSCVCAHDPLFYHFTRRK